MKNNIFRFRAQRSWKTIRNIFGSVKIHGNPTHLVNVFNFESHTLYIFFGPESHKRVTFNALWKQFKMANNRKIIDANQRFSLIYNPSYN